MTVVPAMPLQITVPARAPLDRALAIADTVSGDPGHVRELADLTVELFGGEPGDESLLFRMLHSLQASAAKLPLS